MTCCWWSAETAENGRLALADRHHDLAGSGPRACDSISYQRVKARTSPEERACGRRPRCAAGGARGPSGPPAVRPRRLGGLLDRVLAPGRVSVSVPGAGPVDAGSDRSSHAWRSTMAAALSITRRAARPVRPPAATSARPRRSSAARRPSRPRRPAARAPAQRVGLGEGGTGGGAGRTREAQREPDDDGRGLHLADGVDDGAASTRGRRCARSSPPTGSPACARCRCTPRRCAWTRGRRPRPPGPGRRRHCRRSRDRSRRASANAASSCEGSFPRQRHVGRAPPPPRHGTPRARRARHPGNRRSPPRSPRWPRRASRQARPRAPRRGAAPPGPALQGVASHVVAARHHDAAVGRGRLGQRPCLRLAATAGAASRAPARPRAGVPSRARWRRAARRVRCAAARRPTAPDARARGRPLAGRVTRQREDPPRVGTDGALRHPR